MSVESKFDGPIPTASTPFMNADGRTVNKAWLRFFETMWRRTGGPYDNVFDNEARTIDNEDRIGELQDITQDNAAALEEANIEGIQDSINEIRAELDRIERFDDEEPISDVVARVFDTLEKGLLQIESFILSLEEFDRQELRQLRDDLDALLAIVLDLDAQTQPERVVEAVFDVSLGFLSLTLQIPLAVTSGGTGANTQSGARTNLGLDIGSDVQAHSNELDGLAALSSTGFLVRTGAATYTERSLSAATGITILNGDGVSANPTIAASTNLQVLENNPLTNAEMQQLQNIGTSTISAAQWGYVGNLDQNLRTTDDVTFDDVTATGSVVLPSYTVAGLPAGKSTGAMAYCTNETGGAVPVFYDGSDWRRVTDRAVAS